MLKDDDSNQKTWCGLFHYLNSSINRLNFNTQWNIDCLKQYTYLE